MAKAQRLKEVKPEPKEEKGAKPAERPAGKPGKPGKPEKAPRQVRRESVPAKVTEVIRRTGATGEITQVRCEVIDGRDKGKVMRRNIKGPIRVGDILMLKQTFIEAGEIRQV